MLYVNTHSPQPGTKSLTSAPRAADPEKMLKCCYDKHVCVKVPKKPKCDTCHKKDDKKDDHKKEEPKKDDHKKEEPKKDDKKEEEKKY